VDTPGTHQFLGHPFPDQPSRVVTTFSPTSSARLRREQS
jgi:hypothetical protein